MSKRLPEPADGRRVRLVLADGELSRVEMMAAECRLSVASFLRAMTVATVEDWPDRMAKVKAAAAKIDATASPEKKRPGRPRKEEGGPKKPKK